jgi:hypothetical protein
MVKTRLSFQFKKEENEAAGSLNSKKLQLWLKFQNHVAHCYKAIFSVFYYVSVSKSVCCMIMS